MMPDVVTKIKNEKFTLRILSYRELTEIEKAQSISAYLRQNRLKALPKEGKGTLVTIIGVHDS